MLLNNADVSKIVRLLPNEVRKEMLKGRCVLAGGFIRDAIAGNEINDIDLFPLYPAPVRNLTQAIANDIAFPYEPEPSSWAYNIKGFAYPVQVIRHGRPQDAQQVLDSFDYAMCKAAIWYQPTPAAAGWKSLCHELFYQDVAAKRLTYCGSESEVLGSSLNRMLKFYGKGYTATNASIAAVIARAATSDSQSPLTIENNVAAALRNVYGVISDSEEERTGSFETPASSCPPPMARATINPNVTVTTVPQRASYVNSRASDSQTAYYRRMRTAPGNQNIPVTFEDFMRLPFTERNAAYINYNNFYEAPHGNSAPTPAARPIAGNANIGEWPSGSVASGYDYWNPSLIRPDTSGNPIWNPPIRGTNQPTAQYGAQHRTYSMTQQQLATLANVESVLRGSTPESSETMNEAMGQSPVDDGNPF